MNGVCKCHRARQRQRIAHDVLVRYGGEEAPDEQSKTGVDVGRMDMKRKQGDGKSQ